MISNAAIHKQIMQKMPHFMNMDSSENIQMQPYNQEAEVGVALLGIKELNKQHHKTFRITGRS